MARAEADTARAEAEAKAERFSPDSEIGLRAPARRRHHRAPAGRAPGLTRAEAWLPDWSKPWAPFPTPRALALRRADHSDIRPCSGRGNPAGLPANARNALGQTLDLTFAEDPPDRRP
jgi:hypothetical protein